MNKRDLVIIDGGAGGLIVAQGRALAFINEW
jgi:hypothetical protein